MRTNPKSLIVSLSILLSQRTTLADFMPQISIFCQLSGNVWPSSGDVTACRCCNSRWLTLYGCIRRWVTLSACCMSLHPTFMVPIRKKSRFSVYCVILDTNTKMWCTIIVLFCVASYLLWLWKIVVIWLWLLWYWILYNISIPCSLISYNWQY